MNGSDVQAKKPICKCLSVAAAVVCLCACSHERVCLRLSACRVALRCVCVRVGVFISDRCSGRCCDDSPLVAPLCDLQLLSLSFYTVGTLEIPCWIRTWQTEKKKKKAV